MSLQHDEELTGIGKWFRNYHMFCMSQVVTGGTKLLYVLHVVAGCDRLYEASICSACRRRL